MNINKVNHTIESRPFEFVRHFRRELVAHKTRQLDGGENYVVAASETLEQTFARTDIIQTFELAIDVAPLDLALVNSELALALYVNNDGDPDYLFPDGAELTAGMLAATWLDWRRDLAISDEGNGIISYLVTVRHLSQADVGISNYYLKARIYYPQKTLT